MTEFSLALEIVKVVGSIGGLASAAFLIWDRCMSGRPRVFVRRSDRVNEKGLELVIHNISAEDIIIYRATCNLPSIRVAQATDLAARVGANIDLQKNQILEHTCTIGGHTTAAFAIMVDSANRLHHGYATFEVEWRPTSSFWLPRYPVKLTKDVTELRTIESSPRHTAEQ